MKFYICKHCGNIITFMENKGVPVMCCGEKMSELIPGQHRCGHRKTRSGHLGQRQQRHCHRRLGCTSDARGALDQMDRSGGRRRLPAQDPETGRQTGGCLRADRERQGSCRLRLLRPARPVERKRINDTIFQKNTSKQKRASEIGRPLFS